jgi:zinc transport system substrate-binding protein
MIFMLSLFVCAIFGGAKKETPENSGTLHIVATNFPSYDFVRAVAGGTANITLLLPPGAESHSFEPRPKDIITIQNCDMFIYTGGESEAWVDRILGSMDFSKKKIIRMLDVVDAVEEEIVEGMQKEEDEEEVAYDEHIWTSPQNVIFIVRSIRDGLSEVDPVKASLYRKNAENYTKSFDELDKEFQAIVDAGKRKTIIFGDRFPFRYFADAYGLTYFAAFPGCSTETEPAAATVAFLINKIKAEKIPVVFHLELSNEKMADTIAAETGAKKLLFHAGHNISKKDFDSGLTFLEIQQANVPRLREALQ